MKVMAMGRQVFIICNTDGTYIHVLCVCVCVCVVGHYRCTSRFNGKCIPYDISMLVWKVCKDDFLNSIW